MTHEQEVDSGLALEWVLFLRALNLRTHSVYLRDFSEISRLNEVPF
jgi:hypothetical protein